MNDDEINPDYPLCWTRLRFAVFIIVTFSTNHVHQGVRCISDQSRCGFRVEAGLPSFLKRTRSSFLELPVHCLVNKKQTNKQYWKGVANHYFETNLTPWDVGADRISYISVD